MSEALLRPAVNQLRDYLPGKNPPRPGIIKLASNENPFGPSPQALAAIAQATKSLQMYPDQKSFLLCEALAKELSLATDKIIIGNGSDEIMQLASATFLKPGEEVVIPEKSFSVYEFVTKLFDGQPVFAPLKDYSVDLSAVARAITPKTKMVFLANPNNPTGTAFTAAELTAFMDRVPENVLVILDEAYGDFAEAKNFPDSLQYIRAGKNVLVLRTFSKLYGLAGLRVGYGLAQPELVKYMYRTKLPFNVNRLAQAGAIGALADEAFKQKTLANNLEGKELLYTGLNRLGLSFKNSEANFVFIKLPMLADEIFITLFQRGIIIRPLTSFGFPDCIRVSIGTKEQNEAFLTALAEALKPAL